MGSQIDATPVASESWVIPANAEGGESGHDSITRGSGIKSEGTRNQQQGAQEPTARGSGTNSKGRRNQKRGDQESTTRGSGTNNKGLKPLVSYVSVLDIPTRSFHPLALEGMTSGWGAMGSASIWVAMECVL